MTIKEELIQIITQIEVNIDYPEYQDIEEVKDEKLEDGVVYEHSQADPIKGEETKDGVKFVEGGF